MIIMAPSVDGEKRRALERKFYHEELFSYEVYTELSKREKAPELKRLLATFATGEKRHAALWERILKKEGGKPTWPLLFRLRITFFLFVRMILGLALTLKLLENSEGQTLNEYKAMLEWKGLDKKEKADMRAMIKDEAVHEKELLKRMEKYRGELDYIGSIVFGLNDGLVEILAVVAGLAVLATTGIVVVIGGLIVGISGTLSMAGGAYLSAKSHGLVEGAMEERSSNTLPGKEALYTGVFYFIGAIISTLPFMLGLSGYEGIALAVVLVVIALAAVSTIIAVVSGTRISRRVTEMIAISLAAALVTIVLGSIIRTYFGISI